MNAPERDGRLYALRDDCVFAAEELLASAESAELVSTYLCVLLARPDRRVLANELLEDIEQIMEHDRTAEWRTAHRKLKGMLSRRAGKGRD